MNPPSALNSAMSRDRKPFTYTPGGIDLSEIKSQRMAQRLMRNAMNPGVPEKPVHPVLPAGTPTVPVALPNYNCLPVQVFPAMPANPKTLLRTRSNPDPRNTPSNRVNAPAFVNNTKFENNDTLFKNTPTYSQQINNNRPMSMYEHSTVQPNTYNSQRLSYGSDGFTTPAAANLPTNLPSYGYAPVAAPISTPIAASLPAPITAAVAAPIFAPVAAPVPAPITAPVTAPKFAAVAAPISAPVAAPIFAPVADSTPAPLFAPVQPPAPKLPESNPEPEFFRIPRFYSETTSEQLPKFEACVDNDIVPANESVETSIDFIEKPTEDVTVKPIEDATNFTQEESVVSIPLVTKSVEEIADIDNEQREVKVVKKQVTNTVEEQNGTQNGETNGDAEMTVKLPTKKSGAKTETKVEIEKRTLPDGSIEEVKTTTTKTTIDGRTEIKTRTETTIIPKEEESEEEVVEEVEEEAEVQEEEIEEPETVTVTQTITAPKENGSVVKTEERSETTITKKVAVVQETSQPEQAEEEEEEEVVEEEIEDAEPVTIVLKKQTPAEPEPEPQSVEEEAEEVVEELEESEPVQETQKEVKQEVEEEVQETITVEESKQEVAATPTKEDEEEEYEEAEDDNQIEVKEEIKTESNETEQEIVSEEMKDEVKEKVKEDVNEEAKEEVKEEIKEEVKEEIVSEKPADELKEDEKAEERVIPVQVETPAQSAPAPEEQKPEVKPTEFTIPIREPSIPLDKVEDVEIKPIGITPIITKTHTENTEIITSSIDPTGGLSRQTEYNKIENIVTVNRTTKILDHNYENLTQQGVPTVKTYFSPHSIDRIASPSTPARPYQPVYPPEPVTERRHSLLLERLSMERQMPSDIIYNNHYSNQSYEQSQYQGEPQSEVLTVSNVKPSTITNQQWYQQKQQSQSTLYNNVTSTSTPVGAPWAQPKSPQPQQQYQPAPQPVFQAQYQPPFQRGTTPQPQFQRGTTPQPQFQRGTTPQPQFQRGTTPQPQFQKAATPQPQFQPSYTEPTRDRTPTNNYSSYTPGVGTPTWVASAVESTPTQYSSYLNQDTTQSYQKNTLSSTSQQYSSSYVPPPWEQDSSYTSVNNTSEKYVQEVGQANTFSPAPSQGWQPTPPPTKFSKPAPIAYVPPAPNKSFVAPASNVESPRQQPGRKTYYSEYERRYITVPESTYIPTETKYQPQPDPSPQYYYDNNEPAETVEPQWRKELREFTEKTSQTQTTQETNVQPPWEADTFAKTPASSYTPTPTWSQTLRPQSYRERSFESEFVSQEWPKTNTLGRGRPLSTMGKSVDSAVPERARGVSVDRYNPNYYQPPAEHPPVQSHTLTPTPQAGCHNPNVPGYHARASAEPREQPANYQQRVYREARASPLQSRSFKYLQWITGTEN